MAGCAPKQIESNKATINFYSKVEPKGWVRGSSNVEWGLLFTTDDLVIVKENKVPNQDRTVLINHPRYYKDEFLNKMATIKGIENSTNTTFTIEPGVYDWLVLLDIEGDGVIDGYLGTLASHGPLSSYEFQAGKSYFIELDKSGKLSFKSD